VQWECLSPWPWSVCHSAVGVPLTLAVVSVSQCSGSASHLGRGQCVIVQWECLSPWPWSACYSAVGVHLTLAMVQQPWSTAISVPPFPHGAQVRGNPTALCTAAHSHLAARRAGRLGRPALPRHAVLAGLAVLALAAVVEEAEALSVRLAHQLGPHEQEAVARRTRRDVLRAPAAAAVPARATLPRRRLAVTAALVCGVVQSSGGVGGVQWLEGGDSGADGSRWPATHAVPSGPGQCEWFGSPALPTHAVRVSRLAVPSACLTVGHRLVSQYPWARRERHRLVSQYPWARRERHRLVSQCPRTQQCRVP
jgi:hypothetical protein